MKERSRNLNAAGFMFPSIAELKSIRGGTSIT
jgi:hypothetical protein